MTDYQNPESAKLNPGDIIGMRPHTVDRGIDLLAVARESMRATRSRIPRHPLLDTSSDPHDIWQANDHKYTGIINSQKTAVTEQKAPFNSYIAPGSQGAQPVYQPDSPVSLELESPEELLRRANQGIKDAYDNAPQEEIKL